MEKHDCGELQGGEKMKPILVHVTAPDERDAEMIGTNLVKKKLASCVMMLPGIHSQYIWKGKFQHDKEVLLLIKTFDTKYRQVEKTIKKLHCYETPAIFAVPITKISKEYLKWSKQST
ncbi:MAG: divalent-cation tolerance protein CutA [Candidatus Woesearchaeota archaeon]